MNFWDVILPVGILMVLLTIIVLLVMSFYQTAQEAASKHRIQELDAQTRFENAKMQRFESEVRVMNKNGGHRP